MSLPGFEIVAQMREQGLPERGIGLWEEERARQLRDEHGWNAKEIAKYFGRKMPDVSRETSYWESTIKGFAERGEIASSLIEVFEAGFDQSTSGLLSGPPDKFMPDDPHIAQRIAAQAGALAGDIPFFIVGGAIGAAGGPVGSTAGAFALPAALRKMLMDYYEDGEIDNSEEFMDRLVGTLLETAKGAAIGAATGGAGLVASKAIGAAAKLPAEIATMVTAGAALEGHIPQAQDFVDAAILIGGLRGTQGTISFASKHLISRKIYAKTGVGPEELVLDAFRDGKLVEDYNSSNLNAAGKSRVPRLYKHLDKTDYTKDVDLTPKTAKVIAKLEGQLKKDHEAIARRISVGKKDNRKWYTLDDFFRDMTDEIHPIGAVVRHVKEAGGIIETLKDPYKVTRMLRGSVGVAKHYLEHGVIDAKTRETIFKSFKEIVEQIPEERFPLFPGYGVSRRAVELFERPINAKGKKAKLIAEDIKSGKRFGIDIEGARRIVKAHEAEFGPVFDELRQYQAHVLKYATDRGLLSENERKIIDEMNQDFFPFHRLADPQRVNSLFKIGESERIIIDPMESIVKNTYSLIERAESNHARVVFVEFLESHGKLGKIFGERVKNTVREVGFTDKEVNSIIGKLQEGQALTGKQHDKIKRYLLQKHVAVDAPSSEGKDRLVVYRNGKREVWNVHEDIVRAFDGVDQQSANIMIKLLSVPAVTLRAGAVLTPDFMVRNLIRDSTMAGILSGNGFLPFVSAARGAFSLAKKDADYQLWLQSGGLQSAFVSGDRVYFQKDFRALMRKTGSMDSVRNAVRHPLETLRIASTFIEEATRVGEFRLGIKKARKAGRAPTPEEIATAGFASREITLDFGRVGAKARAVNMISAFFNAQIQGTSRVIRGFRDNPALMGARVTMAITAPSLLLHLYNHDKQWYKEMPRWQKDLFWLVEADGHIFRIPKPFELGILFGTVPERIMSSILDDDPGAYDEVLESLAAGILPNPVPTAAIPVYESITNHSLFLDRPLIPRSRERLLPQMRYSHHTSELTKALAKLAGTLPGLKSSDLTAPAVIDNFVQQWSGGLGRQAMELASAMLVKAGVLPDPVDPTGTLADTFFVRSLMARHPNSAASSVTKFYEKAAKHEEPYNTYKYFLKTGQYAEADKIYDQYEGDFFHAGSLRSTISDVGSMIVNIDNNPDIPPDEKREMIDELYFERISAAQAGLEVINDYEDRIGERKLELFHEERARVKARKSENTQASSATGLPEMR